MPAIEEYTIGCICALKIEAVALRLFLDETYERPTIPSTHLSINDNNVYNTGAIGGHKIAIATLPMKKYGVSQTTKVVADMVRSFPNLRCCLMVGIGGGAPSPQYDIRLGDVVVSAPVDRSGGILQYDHGKAVQGQPFRVTQHLNEPPGFLLSAVGTLAQDFEIEGHPLHSMIDDILSTKPHMKAKYQRPDEKHDRLYLSSVTHPNDRLGNCEELCGTEDDKLVERKQRETSIGVACVHHGIVASGSSLMKDALIRDRLHQEEHVLCFEMEAAGLANQLPCLVIRGICDYSDSHKNDQWQGYAAMMAAAYAKELLKILSPSNVSAAEKVVDKLAGIQKSVQQLTRSIQDTQDAEQDKEILRWLPSIDYTGRHNALQRERLKGTGQWFLDDLNFQRWLHQNGSILFCPGIPGAGKSHIASIVVHHLQSCVPKNGTWMAYMYCEYTQQYSRETLLASLLHQLVQQQCPLPVQLHILYQNHEKASTQPSEEELRDILFEVVSGFDRCFIVVDGLDECTDDGGIRRFLLDTLIKLRDLANVNILATSRDIKHIGQFFKNLESLRIEIRATNSDIASYLDQQIPRVLPLLADDSELCSEIKYVIINAAKGMFLLAMLHVNSLKGKVNVKAIKDTLKEMKYGASTLTSAYEKTMKMIKSQESGETKLAMNALSWVAFSRRSLSVEELQHALAIELGKDELDHTNITKIDIIVSACAGLITVSHGWFNATVRLVHETTQEYLDRTSERWFQNLRPTLARLSLTYITFRTFERVPCMSDIEERATFRRYPLYKFLLIHFESLVIEVQEEPRVKAQLENFFLRGICAQVFMRRKYIHVYDEGSDKGTALHLALHYHIHSVLHSLLHVGVNSRDGFNRTPLHIAVREGFYKGIQLLLSAPEAQCNAIDIDGRTALAYACNRGDEKAVQLLLGCHQIDCNVKDKWRRSPLCYALETGHRAVAQLLLGKAETDCVTPDSDGISPIGVAIHGGHEGCIYELLKRPEVDDNTQLIDWTRSPWKDRRRYHLAGSYGNAGTILHWAIQFDKEFLFEQMLCKTGINVNITDHYGTTPLICSLSHRAFKMTMLLLSRDDLELNVFNEIGDSALFLAVQWGDLDVVDRLVQKMQWRLSVKDKCHRSVLDWAAHFGHWQVLQHLLRKFRPRIRIEADFDSTALSYAIKREHLRPTELLLERIDTSVGEWPFSALALSMECRSLRCFAVLESKLCLWMRSHPEWINICLFRAAERGTREILRYMLNTLQVSLEGARTEQVDFLGDRAWDDIDIRELISEISSAKIDLRDKFGQTALHSAASRGDDAAVRVLSEMGADAYATDSQGRTVWNVVRNVSFEANAASRQPAFLTTENEQPRDGG